MTKCPCTRLPDNFMSAWSCAWLPSLLRDCLIMCMSIFSWVCLPSHYLLLGHDWIPLCINTCICALLLAHSYRTLWMAAWSCTWLPAQVQNNMLLCMTTYSFARIHAPVHVCKHMCMTAYFHVHTFLISAYVHGPMYMTICAWLHASAHACMILCSTACSCAWLPAPVHDCSESWTTNTWQFVL